MTWGVLPEDQKECEPACAEPGSRIGALRDGGKGRPLLAGTRHGLLHFAETIRKPWEKEERVFHLGLSNTELRRLRIRKAALTRTSIRGEEFHLEIELRHIENLTHSMTDLAYTNEGNEIPEGMLGMFAWGHQPDQHCTLQLVGPDGIKPIRP